MAFCAINRGRWRMMWSTRMAASWTAHNFWLKHRERKTQIIISANSLSIHLNIFSIHYIQHKRAHPFLGWCLCLFSQQFTFDIFTSCNVCIYIKTYFILVFFRHQWNVGKCHLVPTILKHHNHVHDNVTNIINQKVCIIKLYRQLCWWTVNHWLLLASPLYL